MVVVRRGQAAQDNLDGLPFRLPGVPRAREGHRLDLRERISRPESLSGGMRRRSTLATAFAEASGGAGELGRGAGGVRACFDLLFLSAPLSVRRRAHKNK